MLLDLKPWTIEYDQQATQHYYSQNEFLINKENNDFFNAISIKEIKQLLQKLGVDSSKVNVKTKLLSSHNKLLSINFLVCGKIKVMPQEQASMYKEFYDIDVSDKIEILKQANDDISVFEIEDWMFRVKLPQDIFESSPSKVKEDYITISAIHNHKTV
ncbi:hypothetical protein [Mycoplasma sp. P36-A1]|uniref:hypothetical protein n=1 Tax=Mycoplasma sp. P36-A1 TaxID=3252900 RepID=UPI003C2ADC3E